MSSQHQSSTSSLRPRGLRVGAALLALSLASASLGVAAPPSLGKGDAAWHQGELDVAMTHYQQAVKAGGLQPDEVVLAYSRIGAVQAALGEEKAALNSFRVAVTVDPEFVPSADSGPVAKALVDKARAEVAAIGDYLSLSISAQELVPAKKEFTIVTVLPEAYITSIAEVSVEVEDLATKKRWRQSKPAEAQNEFKVPKRVATSGAKLKVTARALDEDKNAWAVAEQKIGVKGKTAAGADDGDEISPFEPTKAEGRRGRDDKSKEGGFFSGPTPWLVGGGVVVVAAVVATVLLLPSNEASVGAPSWSR